MRLLGHQMRQPTLFEDKPKSAFETQAFRLADVCSRLDVTVAELRSWRNVGFLTFDPETTWPYERWMYLEIAFVRDLMRTEFSINAVRRLLSSLKAPYAYTHHDVCYDFHAAHWRHHSSAKDVLSTSISAPEQMEQTLLRGVEALSDFGRGDILLRVRTFIDQSLRSSSEGE